MDFETIKKPCFNLLGINKGSLKNGRKDQVPVYIFEPLLMSVTKFHWPKKLHSQFQNQCGRRRTLRMDLGRYKQNEDNYHGILL